MQKRQNSAIKLQRQKQRYMSMITALLLAVGLLGYFLYGAPADGQSVEQELLALQRSLAVMPEVAVPDVRSTHQAKTARVEAVYTADVSYPQVRRFYMESLPQQGWVFSSEETVAPAAQDRGTRKMRFCKNEYRLVVEYSDAGRTAGKAAQWQITLSWGPVQLGQASGDFELWLDVKG